MALHYCSLHQRLFSFTQHTWLPFPEDKIQEIRGYHALLSATHADNTLHVLDRPCDRCQDTFRQVARVNKPRDPSP